MNEIKQRWIEVSFAYFAYDLYQSVKNFTIVVEYVEFLADLANLDRYKAQNILLKVLQQAKVIPSDSEFIYLAKHSEVPVRTICKILHISMSTYQIIKDNLPKELDIMLQYNQADRDLMQELLNQHNRVKTIGV